MEKRIEDLIELTETKFDVVISAIQEHKAELAFYLNKSEVNDVDKEFINIRILIVLDINNIHHRILMLLFLYSNYIFRA